MNGKWMNNPYEDGDWLGEKFDTREEAIEDGRRQYREALAGYASDLFDDCEDLSEAKSFYVARIERFAPRVDAEHVLERIGEAAYDFGGEYGEDYLMHVSEPDKDDLQASLQKAFDDWTVRTRNEPGFYTCVDTEKVRAAE